MQNKGGLVDAVGHIIPKVEEPLKPLGRITWEPMPGKIVVQVVGERETFGRAGVIIRPQTSTRPRTTGKVVAVYDSFLDYGDKEETTSFVKVDDIIVFGQHSGVEIEYGGEKVVVLREQEILTRVKVESAEDIAHLGVAAGALDDVPA